MTGGMAFEGLNNLGHSGKRVVIILNDNGRSYAPTISKLSESISRLRLNPQYVSANNRLERLLRDLPGVGELAYSSVQGLTAGLREMLEPTAFFESLGVRYSGPIDGHDIPKMETALRNAAEYDGPIVVARDAKTGRELWTRRVPNPDASRGFNGFAASPTRIYVLGGERVEVLVASSGEWIGTVN
jgi:1-deoxy-D-xylulose-5-phosphate synthase